MKKNNQNENQTDKEFARDLYIMGLKVADIENETGIGARTLYYWIKDGNWQSQRDQTAEIITAENRLRYLISKDPKTALELREIQIAMDTLERLVKLDESRRVAQLKARLQLRAEKENYEKTQIESVGRAVERKSKNKNESAKNDFSDFSDDYIFEHFMEGLFQYQKELYSHIKERVRNILKSRQIGLTYYFAREALADAILTGKNKVFLSASKAQSGIFRTYIKAFAKAWCNIDLKGKDEIQIYSKNSPKEEITTLYFLSTNSATSQGYHGDVYVDEYFWIGKFAELDKLASAMAAHKKWTRTYFSTPSTKTHEAYPKWSGDEYNDNLAKRNKKSVEFPSRKELRDGGRLCPDGVWRRIITLDDAERDGCNLFDKKALIEEYSPEAYKQLFDCHFIDTAGCVFQFEQLLKCHDDPTHWKDFSPTSRIKYPYPVWVGYDPARMGDGSVVVVIAPPTAHNKNFRILEKIDMRGYNWQYQADQIQKICNTYHVEHLAIDTTKQGSGVLEAVRMFYPRATGIHYANDLKIQMVVKAQDVIGRGIIKWDPNHADIARAFLSITNAMTGDRTATFKTKRTATAGHGDAAWAIMHALIKDPLVQRRATAVF